VKFKHRPDVLVIDPAGRVVAVELELTFKTVKRYAEEVIPSHARQICVEQKYQHVLWVCPTAEDTERMKNLIRQATERLRKSESRVMYQLEAYKQKSEWRMSSGLERPTTGRNNGKAEPKIAFRI
jgi:hypothetical protein